MKTLLFRIFILLSSILALLQLTACNNEKTYESELESLENSLLSLDSANVIYNSLPFDSLQVLFKKVKGDMELLQDSYKGDMDKDLGVLFSRYRDIPNNIKNLPSVRGKVQAELNLGNTQLNQLKEAILSNANKDSQGNSIDAEYIKRNTNIETKAVQNLVSQVKLLQTASNSAMSQYDKYYPQVKPTLDSLRLLTTETP